MQKSDPKSVKRFPSYCSKTLPFFVKKCIGSPPKTALNALVQLVLPPNCPSASNKPMTSAKKSLNLNHTMRSHEIQLALIAWTMQFLEPQLYELKLFFGPPTGAIMLLISIKIPCVFEDGYAFSRIMKCTTRAICLQRVRSRTLHED